MQPLITIGIALYNAEDLAAKVINSATSQTYKNLEIIVIDDYSEDSTSELCKFLAIADSRIKLIINTKNEGILNTYNRILSLAKGEFFILFDQDDWRDLNYIDTAFNAMSVNSKRVLVHSPTTVRFTGKVMHINKFSRLSERHTLLGRISTVARRPDDFLAYGLIRTKSIRQVGGFQLSLSAFHGLIMSLAIQGDIFQLQDTNFFYSAKGLNNRLTPEIEMQRHNTRGNRKSRLQFTFSLALAYKHAVFTSELKRPLKASIFLIVIWHFMLRLMGKIVYVASRKLFGGSDGELYRFIVKGAFPVDEIEFVTFDDSLGYYKQGWPIT
jgi:glycosyltransferase involved in cell wall biosynthesis